MRVSPEFANSPHRTLNPELLRRVGEDTLSRLSQLTTSITEGIKQHPAYLIPAFAVLYLTGHIIHSIPNFRASLVKEQTSENGNKKPLVIFPNGDSAFIRQQLRDFGEVIPTGSVGVRITEPEGINVRYLPDKKLGSRVETGHIEPYYKVHQYHEYNPELINVSHFIRTKDGDIWAVSWGDPDENNGGLRYLNLFAVKEGEVWLADFMTEDRQNIPGEVLFGFFK